MTCVSRLLPVIPLALAVTLAGQGTAVAQTKPAAPKAAPAAPAPRPAPAAPTRPPATSPSAATPAAPATPGAAPAAKPAGGGSSASGGRSNSPIVIDADRMEAMKKEGLIIFTGNVVAKQDNSTQNADRMEVYLDDKGERVMRIVSTGNVKIVTEDCRTGTAKRAEYYDDDQLLKLIGDAKVWQEDNVVTGDEIDILLAEDRSTVRGGNQTRVKSVFYPKRDENKTEETPKVTAGTPKSAERKTCG